MVAFRFVKQMSNQCRLLLDLNELRIIQIICGALLVIYGALILGGQFGLLGDWLSAWTVW